MAYFGPKLQSYPKNVSIWDWLFGSGEGSKHSSPQSGFRISENRGFRDAATGDFLSFRDLRDKATWLSSALVQVHNLQAHQTVAIVSCNSIWYPVALFSAGRLGAVVTPLPHESKAEDLAYFFRSSKTVLVYADKATLAEVKQACKIIGLPNDRVVLLCDQAEGQNTIQDLVERGRRLDPATTAEQWKPAGSASRTHAFLCFTSGTTGRPKAVMISHTNVIAQLCQVEQLGLQSRNRTILGVLPFYHITGLVHLLHLPMVLEQDIIIMAKFNMQRMMDTIVKFGCNELWLVPPLLIRLLSDPVARDYDLSFVKQFNTGAAPLSEQVIAQLAKRFPHIAIRQAWGMTESTSCITLTPPGLTSWENATKVGKLVPGTEIRIVDLATRKDVAKGDTGEIWARGPQVSMGYLNNRAATEETFDADGYLRTGDLGAIDEDGFIVIHDRLKEMIKVRGYGVAPAELEDLLHGHPDVNDVAVVGIPDYYSGEVPRAIIVLKPGVKPDDGTMTKLQEHVKTRKARHKWLAGGVEFVPEIPKSASGKILRRVLKESWKQNEGRSQSRQKL